MESCPYQLVGNECSDPRFGELCISLANQHLRKEGLQESLIKSSDYNLIAWLYIYTSSTNTCLLRQHIENLIRLELESRNLKPRIW